MWEMLTPTRREKLETGEAAMKWLHRGESIERWRDVGDAANELQAVAMDCARTNKPTGKGYNKAWAELAGHVPHIRDLNSTTRTHASWMATNWEAVSRWLHTLSAEERMKLNHPTAIRRRYDAAHRAPDDNGNAAATLSPTAQAKATIAQQAVEIDRLRRMADAGSLFDLKRDHARDIGRVILNTIGDDKVSQLIKVLTEGRKEKQRKRAAHAG